MTFQKLLFFISVFILILFSSASISFVESAGQVEPFYTCDTHIFATVIIERLERIWLIFIPCLQDISYY
jgi:hypothetical protein